VSDPFHLIPEGRFQEAFELYSKELELGASAPALANRALSALNLGDLDQALADFARADELDRSSNAGRGSSYASSLAMVMWLRGSREGAATLWRKILVSIEEGEITHSDLSGGVGVAALLWFSAIGLRRTEDRKLAESFMWKKWATARGKQWPGPIGGFLLGQLSRQELGHAAKTQPEKLEARRQCQATFYAGAKAGEAGDLRCEKSELEDSVKSGGVSLIEREYYLAKHELKDLLAKGEI
jgi:tetratricopeptide (TPR) repeat protein